MDSIPSKGSALSAADITVVSSALLAGTATNNSIGMKSRNFVLILTLIIALIINH
jgi:hypothetical protein